MSAVFFKPKGLMVMPNLWWIWGCFEGLWDASKIPPLPSSFHGTTATHMGLECQENVVVLKRQELYSHKEDMEKKL